MGEAVKPADTHGGQHGRAEGGIVHLDLLQLQSQNIRHDLTPEHSLRAAADDAHPLHFHAQTVQGVQAVLQAHGDALQGGAGEVGGGVAGADAGVAALQIRVIVGRQLAV